MPKEEKTQIEMEKKQKNKVAHARKKVPTLNMFNPTSKNNGFKPSIFFNVFLANYLLKLLIVYVVYHD